MSNEFWQTIFLVVIVPLVQQLIKVISDRTGYTFDQWLNQLIALALAGLFGWLTGGFAGIEFPTWTGDLIAFLEQFVLVVGVFWAALKAAYDVIWDNLFGLVATKTPIKFVTRDELS